MSRAPVASAHVPSRPPFDRPGAPDLAQVAGWLGAAPPATGADTRVSGVSLASDRVQPGDLFAAVAGAARHGAAFADAAVRAGAVAVLTDPAGAAAAAAAGVPVLVVPDVRAVLGGLAARLAGEPARELTVLAVTGTSGKTTTTYLLEAGLRGAGRHPGVVGTIGTRIDGEPVPSALTTPEAPDLQRLLARMVRAGADSVALEVSSHALVLHRVDGVVADVALFTNLGRDHLDFHGDMASYLAAKLMLFTPARARAAVVCTDDGPAGYGAQVAAAARAAGLATVTVTGQVPVTGEVSVAAPGDWAVTSTVAVATGGSRFTLRAPDGAEHPGRVRLHGRFNVTNAALAVAALVTAGLDPSAALAGIADLRGVPGRLEFVTGDPFPAWVDYAHKPEALDAVLTELRELVAPGGRLGVVLGAGGDRDRGKRPVLGAVAARLADVVVVTDDNPRSEDPAAIRAAVLAGAAAGTAAVAEVGDRRAAIRRAAADLGPGSVLVVAGKGSETGQLVDGVVHPFDDRVEVAAAMAALAGSGVRA